MKKPILPLFLLFLLVMAGCQPKEEPVYSEADLIAALRLNVEDNMYLTIGEPFKLELTDTTGQLKSIRVSVDSAYIDLDDMTLTATHVGFTSLQIECFFQSGGTVLTRTIFVAGLPFSVSRDEQVILGPSNLTYQSNTKTWEMTNLGFFNGSATEDLFGWGAGNDPNKTSTDNSSYSTFVDYGTNPIFINTARCAPDTWFTATMDQWEYLLYSRENAEKKRGIATDGEYNCAVLLPDDFVLPEGLTFTPETKANEVLNKYTVDEFYAMRMAGAIFLPMRGFRLGEEYEFSNKIGLYWCADLADEDNANMLQFSLEEGTGAQLGSSEKRTGHSIRLMRPMKHGAYYLDDKK